MIKDYIKSQIAENKIIAIIRGIPEENMPKLAEALYFGGIRLAEITFDQSGKISLEQTANGISVLKKEFGNSLMVGAGTVMNIEQVKLAYEAGAKYIISPNINPMVIRETNRLGMVSIPGAMTPTEMEEAHHHGADFVKLFPAGDLGIGYIKSVLAPMNHIKTLAVGGVNEKNLMDFLGAGVSGVGVGSNLVNKALVQSGNYQEIIKIAKKYTIQIGEKENAVYMFR